MVTQTAIEYGASRLRLLEFEGTGRKLRVLGVHEASLDVADDPDDPDAAEDARAALVSEAVEDAGFRRDPSAMAFDSAHAIFREFSLPFTNDDQIRKVVRFESESHMPVDIDDVITQHVVLRKTRDKSHVLVAAVKKDDLLDRIDIVNEAGLDPMHIEIDVLALYHALVGSGVADEHARFAVVDAQERTTTLMFVEDGALHAVRSIRIGTHSVTHGHAVGEDGGAAGGHEREVEAARTHDYLSRLVREIRRTLSVLPAGERELEQVFVTGPGSRLEGFEEKIAQVFGVDAEPLDFLERVDHDLDDDEAARAGRDIGVALGMAYKLNGLDATDTEFRREEAAYTKKFDQVVAPLIVVGFLLFLAVAFMAIDAFMERRKLLNEYAKMEDAAVKQLREMDSDSDDLEQQLLRAEFGPPRISKALQLITGEWDEVAGQLGRGQQIEEQKSALVAWIRLFDTLKRNQIEIGRFALERLDINVAMKQPTIKMSGEVESITKYQVLEDLLRAEPMFTGVTSATLATTPAGTTRFTDISIDLDEALLRGRLN